MTPSIFIRHAGNNLLKFLGMKHDEVVFDNNYTFVEVPGRVVFRSEEDEEPFMVLRAAEPLKLSRRAIVVANPDIAKFVPFNSQSLCEPGDIPTVYIHGYDGFFEDIGIEWLFRIYFIR